MSDVALHHELVPLPVAGRRFTATRRVRWGDADRRGRLRLDGIARYLQDVANDDVRDAGHDPDSAWVVRRTSIEVVTPPRVGELVDVTTWASGSGRCWAERRTTIAGDRGGKAEAVSMWIYLDATTGRPARLTDAFHDTWGEATCGRKVQARNLLGPPRADAADLATRPWPLRSTDLDGFEHVNNAATWEPIEDELARLGITARRADLEYGDAIDAGDDVTLMTQATREDGVVLLWLTVGGVVRASAAVLTG